MDTTLKIGASATIQNCQTIRDEIVTLLSKDKPASIDLSQLSNADICFVQLAYATMNYVSSAGKTTVFTDPPNEYLSSLLARAGLSPSLFSDGPQSHLQGGLPQ